MFILVVEKERKQNLKLGNSRQLQLSRPSKLTELNIVPLSNRSSCVNTSRRNNEDTIPTLLK